MDHPSPGTTLFVFVFGEIEAKMNWLLRPRDEDVILYGKLCTALFFLGFKISQIVSFALLNVPNGCLAASNGATKLKESCPLKSHRPFY